jgi:hypothetical protein
MARSLATRPATAEAIASIASTAKAAPIASQCSKSHAAGRRVLSFDLALIGRADSIQEPLCGNPHIEMRKNARFRAADCAAADITRFFSHLAIVGFGTLHARVAINMQNP